MKEMCQSMNMQKERHRNMRSMYAQMQKHSQNMKIEFHKSGSPGGRHPVDQEPCFPQVAINRLLLLSAFQS